RRTLLGSAEIRMAHRLRWPNRNVHQTARPPIPPRGNRVSSTQLLKRQPKQRLRIPGKKNIPARFLREVARPPQYLLHLPAFRIHPENPAARLPVKLSVSVKIQITVHPLRSRILDSL